MRLTVLVLLVACPLVAVGQVYRCEIDGRVVYQAQACPDGSGRTVIETPKRKPSEPLRRAGFHAADGRTWCEVYGVPPSSPANGGQDARGMQRDGEIWVGMTEADLICSRGLPEKRNRHTSASGVREQWVYRGSLRDSRYFYLDDGIVTSWQD